jgi:hypothetical protein
MDMATHIVPRPRIGKALDGHVGRGQTASDLSGLDQPLAQQIPQLFHLHRRQHVMTRGVATIRAS